MLISSEGDILHELSQRDAQLKPHHHLQCRGLSEKQTRRRQQRLDPVRRHPLGFSKYNRDISDADRHNNSFQCNLSSIDLVDNSSLGR